MDEMTAAPSPALRDRVRASLAEAAPERRGPFWIAGLVAAAIAVTIIGVLFVANPGNRHPVSVPAGSTGPSPTPTAQPTATAFTCSTNPISASSPSTAVIPIDALRTGAHPGYDRLTVEFAGGEPSSMTAQPQSGTTFTLSPSGQPVTLAGQNGILITLHGTDLHTDYQGPLDIVTGYTGLVEVRRVQDFEGVVQLALGVNGPVCFQASSLTNPTRLVIDVQAG
jgi:hypothetical protein